MATATYPATKPSTSARDTPEEVEAEELREAGGTRDSTKACWSVDPGFCRGGEGRARGRGRGNKEGRENQGRRQTGQAKSCWEGASGWGWA